MMKKGLKIIGLSGMILALSVGSIACQKNMSTENTVVNETAMEFVEDTDSEKKLETETDKESKETSEKKTKETDKENKKTSEKKAKETETQNKKISKKKTEEKSDSHKKETEGKEISKKESETKSVESETQKPSKPAETQPTRPTETKPQKPSRPTETKPQKPAETQKPSKPAETQHNHTWLEITEQVDHEAVGHYKTEVIQEAWDEPIYESHNFCNVCLNLDLGSADNAIIHSVETGHGYHSERVQVGTQHHDAVTEQKWVEDKAAWTQTVVTGYKCSSCGETKK